MHVGAVMIFDGPPPGYVDFVNQVRGRLHLVPRYRQKLAIPPIETGRPVWIDDPSFNLEYHIRHTALPSPGSEEQLRNARRAHPLPAARPRQAAVGDVARPGARGQPLRADLQDPPRARRRHRRRRPRDRAVRRRAEPAEAAARGRAVAPAARALLARPRRARHPRARAHAVRAGRPRRLGGDPPGETFETTREAIEGVGEIAWATLNPAPATPLNVEIGPHRRSSSCARSSTTSGSSRTRSAARSTTSC